MKSVLAALRAATFNESSFEVEASISFLSSRLSLVVCLVWVVVLSSVCAETRVSDAWASSELAVFFAARAA